MISPDIQGGFFNTALNVRISADTMTAPDLIAAAGDCLASHYLASWAIARKTDC